MFPVGLLVRGVDVHVLMSQIVAPHRGLLLAGVQIDVDEDFARRHVDFGAVASRLAAVAYLHAVDRHVDLVGVEGRILLGYRAQ